LRIGDRDGTGDQKRYLQAVSKGLVRAKHPLLLLRQLLVPIDTAADAAAAVLRLAVAVPLPVPAALPAVVVGVVGSGVGRAWW